MRFSFLVIIVMGMCSCDDKNKTTVFDSLKEKAEVDIVLSDYNLHRVPKEISVLKKVERLSIKKDTGEWVVYPPLSALGRNTSNVEPVSLPDEITTLSNLKSLALVKLDLTVLPEHLDRLQNLDTLILFANRLTISNELDKLKMLRKLKYLGLLGNDITANDLIQLKQSTPGITINPDLR